MSALLDAGRVREVVTLLGTCGEEAIERRRQHLVDGLRRLFDARASISVRADDYTLLGQPRVVTVTGGGFQGARGQGYLRSVAASVCGDPVIAIAAGLGAGAYRRRDVIADRAWYETRWAAEDHRALDLDDGLYLRASTDGGATECLGVFRPPGAHRFSAEDRALMGLFVSEAPRLLRPPLPPRVAEAARGLSPREAQTLEHLCRGASEKEVAAALAISRNTVHVYVKGLYRRFGVASRSELLARFIAKPTPPAPVTAARATAGAGAATEAVEGADDTGTCLAGARR